MTYCIDTSALIAAWNERYPIRRVPTFWRHVDDLISAGRLVAPEEVRREILKKESGLFDWINARRAMFVDLEDGVQAAAFAILADYPLLVKQLPGRTAADPFVIALALDRKLTVVTEEGPGSPGRPRIPLVCGAKQVPCITLLGLLDTEDWVL